ncbi:Crp/Fnr family transcriptional regulator [Marinibaculum pumilum]|uniref:Crp/Fnr family transcriptional regulator n=1 Tax=Marinibaculum pumilum TaxID=1766165 RepID=A0ABV7L4L7_9PROT
MPDLTFLEPYGLPPRRHSAGATLFRAGTDSAGLYLLLSGRIRLLRPLADGSEVVVHRAAAVDTFAEAAVFSAVYHCDAVAVTEVEVRIVPAAAVRAALAEVPGFAARFAARLAGQVQDLRARAEILSMRGAAERAAAWLALQADGDTVALDRPVKEMATEIGLTHEALYRALAALERDGRIERLARGRFRLATGPRGPGADA